MCLMVLCCGEFGGVLCLYGFVLTVWYLLFWMGFVWFKRLVFVCLGGLGGVVCLLVLGFSGWW